jgi:hypothetical protein
MTRQFSIGRAQAFVGGGVVIAIIAGFLYALLDSGFRLADVERDRDYYLSAARATRRLIIAAQDTSLKVLADSTMMKGPRTFVFGTIEVEVDSTWSKVIEVKW